MTERFDRAVLDAAARLGRDPRTRPILADAVRTAREGLVPRRRPTMVPVTSLLAAPFAASLAISVAVAGSRQPRS